MNYREKLRKAIECPQFRDKDYGEWGALNLEQRRLIKRLLDELDNSDDYVKKIYLENIKQKEVIDKLSEIIYEINNLKETTGGYPSYYVDDLVNILKEVLE